MLRVLKRMRNEADLDGLAEALRLQRKGGEGSTTLTMYDIVTYIVRII
jgi:hypothetical protein